MFRVAPAVGCESGHYRAVPLDEIVVDEDGHAAPWCLNPLPRLGVSFRAEVHMAEIAAFVGEEVDLGVKSGHACFLSTDGGG